MAHPYLRTRLNALKKGACAVDVVEVGTAILARGSRLYLAAIGQRHELCSVADAEYGDCRSNGGDVNLIGAFVVHRQRAARQDYTDDVLLCLLAVGILVVGDDFTIDVQLADSTPYKLGGLRAEVEDDDFLLHNLE